MKLRKITALLLCTLMAVALFAGCSNTEKPGASSGGYKEEIIIVINDTVAHFGLGGPQAEAIYAFINHLAAENLHEVDIENSTVTGNI